MSSVKNEWVCFEGTDNLGTYGRYIVISGDYNSKTCIDRGLRRYEITPENSEMFSTECTIEKHFPQFNQVESWLEKYNCKIEFLYGGYEKQPFDEAMIGNRAIIWAKKL